MDIFNQVSLLVGSSWASGFNLYLTTAILGVAQRMHWVSLPGDMKVVSHPLVIAAAVLMYAVEFVADKIPFVDNAWDTLHTFIRPVGGAAMGYMGAAGLGPVAQIPVAMLTGAIAADSHLTKATSRVAINSTAVPFANSAASVTEDISVATVMYLVIRHPIIAAIVVIVLIVLSILLLRFLFKFLKKVISFITGKAKPGVKAGEPAAV